MEDCIVWLDGGGVLWIDNFFWDINVFRPSLENDLILRKKYKASVQFSTERLLDKKIKYPKILYCNGNIYVNIR